MIHRFQTIDSTNTYAKLLAEKGAPDGTVVVAEQQSGGRGRMGRSFHSPAGKGLYLSMILRPTCKPEELMHLTCAAGVAACQAIKKATEFLPGIKWTNDIIAGKQKLGGILTELGFRGSELDFAVIGIGINCNHCMEDFPSELQGMATSLSMVSGNEIDIRQLEALLICQLQSLAKQLTSHQTEIMEHYRKLCVTLGQKISIHQGDRIRHGTAVDIDRDGGLIVKLPDGRIETIAFGEVSVRGMYGYL